MLGLGLIGGSVLRALRVAGREAFGYNRSVDAVHAARSDGFDASDGITEVLTRAAASDALIVLAVPVPALPIMLDHIRATAPECALTDVVSVKGALLQIVTEYGLLDRYVGGHPMAGTAHSGWAASGPSLFVDAPWVVSVDDHVDPLVWEQVMGLALDCRAFVVPARSDEHDAAVAAISHLPHLFAETLSTVAFNVPLSFALGAGSFRDATRVAATSPDLVRAMCEANSTQLQVMLNRAIYLLEQARNGLSAHASVAELVDSGHAARVGYDSFSRPDILGVTIGADGWRDALAAEGRAGGVIRSALPVRGSRG